LPSIAITPLGPPIPSAWRKAAMQRLNGLSSCAGSSSRNIRLKVSWLGARCGRSTICDSSSSRDAAMSTQVLAPQKRRRQRH
jgi:hypothetical protein